ncbi:GNAT family N-acetyltransferase [Blastococcus brunescens]|uniref:GNAT family N-acetyltransferase n=1 Tax=Blastococcus brunescens TaxID=1564165 RepID=A0ABZ1AYQ7_9ACTN|nr:GNAT family N-acetyltransferase [Blastococcus sp. BMG 8361]WRL63665.1 GNAT family N-acetyltransferase [Blastococcus sp. BMG 8361]
MLDRGDQCRRCRRLRPPVTEDDVVPLLDKLLEGVASGRDVLALLTVDGATAGFASVVGSLSPLRRHWGAVLRVQVHPSRQGQGLGRVLMAGVHRLARDRGWEFLHLTARDGTGVDAFYRGLGYAEVGRLPGAIRVAPGTTATRSSWPAASDPRRPAFGRLGS